MFVRSSIKAVSKAVVGSPMAVRAASSAVSKIDASITALPGREAVRYTEKNMKWTAGEFLRQVTSHTNAMIDLELVKSGDSIALWLRDSAEKHVTMLAAAKLGLSIYDIDVSVTSVDDIRAALKASNCKMIVFDPVDDVSNKLEILRKAIPELYAYDDTYGQRFHSKHFPTLTYLVHTGFDVEMGAINYKDLFLPNPPKDYSLDVVVKDEQPLYTLVSSDGKGSIKMGKTLTHATVLGADAEGWSFSKKFLGNEYWENTP